MKQIQINLPGNSYPVIIGKDIFLPELKKIFAARVSRYFIVTNETLAKIYKDRLEVLKDISGASVCVLSDGEKYKNAQTLNEIYDFLAKEGAIRKDVLIAFGGGVIGDLTGHAAATYMRGIDYIQIPTTLLSQVDSSIGGKTGLNHPMAKNMIGSFKHPIVSLLDTAFLQSLDSRQIMAGYAEIFKHSLIRDRKLYDFLIEQNPQTFFENHADPEDLIYRSCLVKAKVVETDEKEENLRAILNFGHTIGHMLETVTGYTGYLHGEAVICGMDFSSWRSYRKGFLSEEDFAKIHRHLKQTKIRIQIPPMTEEDFTLALGKDKKKDTVGIRFVNLRKIGEAFIEENTDLGLLWKDFCEYMQTKHSLIQYEK